MATSIDTINIPHAKPAFELIDERLSQKVSPQYDHARLQGTLMSRLSDWAHGRGRVGSEWRFYLDTPEPGHSFVPDVAYLSYDRLPREARAAAQQPHLAPDVAFEILSAHDWQSQVDRKTVLYLEAGGRLVVEVDLQARTMTAHDRSGSHIFSAGDIFEHSALPGFRLDIASLFAVLDD
jgi:Uma2 family endonuclease